MMLQDKLEVVFPLSLKEIVKKRIRLMLRYMNRELEGFLFSLRKFNIINTIY